MHKDRYIYPAVFHYAVDGISIEFPDLPGCFSCGQNTEEAMMMAKEALSLHLYGMESDGDEIPAPSDLIALVVEANDRIVLIEVFMPPFRDMMENKAVKKTLTVPKWLNDLAEKENVNFSLILQSGLKQYLGLRDYRPKKQA